MSTTKSVVNTAVAAAALAVPAVAADALIGTAFWQSPPNHPTVCSEYGCADCDALAAAVAALAADDEADDALDSLLALTDDELDALDTYFDGDDDDAVPFPDGLGWDWPETDWDAVAPF